MLVSILHRVTGDGMAIFGGLGLVWWLCAIASGPAGYANFRYYAWEAAAGDTWGLVVNIFCRIVMIGLTWAFFEHLFSGLRHFVLDIGAGYELRANRRWSIILVVAAILATVALWGWLLFGKGV